MADQQEDHGLHNNTPAGKDRNVTCCCAGRVFEIHIKGHLNDKWLDWLEGLDARLLDNGETVLCGAVIDQAALMGVLNKLNRLNLTLLSVREVSHPDGH